ncbi:hypothetical protein K431DRAFT_318013 [Polychaeton citri CBS 116435]|uniref:Micro-fibrillar-associated protein 1 C-terminal domain-containing protein n=1 Tax=Polychaeton citri CBS 116435 TaxID=1314669 RepID=A0A9P4UQK4_9PEZI|nr:hypothetical protein K431DRAFT_318013 [Polychaeton citri CBS 116435]
MTKNAKHLFRYRPGKAEVEDEQDEFEESEEEEEQQKPVKQPAPKAKSFPGKKLAVDLSKANQQRSYTPQKPKGPTEEDLEGFVTASESEEDDGKESGSEESGSGSEESSEEEESSSDDEPARPMIAPKFLNKAQRAKQQATSTQEKSAEEKEAKEEARRQEKADQVLQAQLERDAAARAAGKKYWDDEDVAPEDEVDDRDGVDPDAERAAWKLRELKRIRRDRMALVEKEKEREEVERRRNLTAEEREREDQEYIESQREEREGKGKMGYMQKYFHKGAFFQGDDDQDEEVKRVLNRDLAGVRFEDEGSKDVMPEYMQIRDMTKLGRKGRSKYRDLQSEDTGRWAEYGDTRRDRDDGGNERSGANAQPVGERRRREDDGGRDREKRPRYE